VKTHNKFGIVLATCAIMLSFGCNKSPESDAMAGKAMALPDTINFTKAALYPEGVEYDAANNRFLVTSLHEGIVGAVKPDGSYAPVFQNPSMISAIGIRIDAKRDRVLVCNSDPGVSIHTNKETQGKLAGLAAFKLSSGELIKYIDLGALSNGGGHFCNDIALAQDGTVYATDSFSPIIYKINSNYNASILIQDKRFEGQGFSLNGIVVKDNALIVAKDNEGVLFRIPLDDPSKFQEVKVDQKMVGADGLVMKPDGSLLVIANANTNKVFKLVSDDGWNSAKVTATEDTGDTFTTTGVEVNGSVYVLNAYLNVLFNPKATKQVDIFTIKKLSL
jgi:sugar lactone lactonase YvrE